jgi:hypothetical protein
MVDRSRREGDKTDAEGTKRLPHVQKALDAGLLNSPPADEPRGTWGIKKGNRKKNDDGS